MGKRHSDDNRHVNREREGTKKSKKNKKKGTADQQRATEENIRVITAISHSLSSTTTSTTTSTKEPHLCEGIRRSEADQKSAAVVSCPSPPRADKEKRGKTRYRHCFGYKMSVKTTSFADDDAADFPPQQSTLACHADRYVRTLALTSDARKIISGGGDNKIVVHDIASGTVDRELSGHTDTVRCLACTLDGERLLSGSTDGTLREWELASGNCLRVINTPHAKDGGVQSMCLSADNELLITGGRDMALVLWQVSTLSVIRTLSSGAAADTAFVKSGDGDAESAPSPSLQHVEPGHTGWVYAVALTQNKANAVSCSRDGTIKIWDIANAFACVQTVRAHSDSVRCVTLTPDDTRILSCSKDKAIKVTALSTGTVYMTLMGHTSAVEWVAAAKNNQHAVSGSDDKTVRIWDLYSGTCLKVLQGHTDWIYNVVMAPSGRQIFSCGRDNTVRIWSLLNGDGFPDIYEGHSQYVREALVIEDGKTLLTCSDDATIKVFDLATGACTATLSDHADSVRAICASPDKSLFLSASWDRTVKVWDVATRACVRTLEGHTDSIRSVFASAKGSVAVSGSRDQTVRVWDYAKGACTAVLEGHTAYVRAVVCNAEGTVVVSGGDDCVVKVWDVPKKKCVFTFTSHKAAVATLAISQDGKRVVSGSRDKSIRIFDIERFVEVDSWSPHTNDINYVTFYDDDTKIISCSHDGFVHIYDAATTEIVRTLGRHPSPVYAVETYGSAILIASGSAIRRGQLSFSFSYQTLRYNAQVNPGGFLVGARDVDGYSAHFLLDKLVDNAEKSITTNLAALLAAPSSLSVSLHYTPLLAAALKSTSEECVRMVTELILKAIHNTAEWESLRDKQQQTGADGAGSLVDAAVAFGSASTSSVGAVGTGAGLFWSPEVNADIGPCLCKMAALFPSLLQRLLAETPLIPAHACTMAGMYPHYNFSNNSFNTATSARMKLEFAPAATAQHPVWLFWKQDDARLTETDIGHINVTDMLPSFLAVDDGDGYSIIRVRSGGHGDADLSVSGMGLDRVRPTRATRRRGSRVAGLADVVSSSRRDRVRESDVVGGTRTTAKMIPFPNITSGPSMAKNDLLYALLKTKRSSMFEGVIPQLLIEYRWRRFGRFQHTLNFSIYIVALACFIALGLLNREIELSTSFNPNANLPNATALEVDDLGNPLNQASLALGAAVSIYLVFNLFRETQQFLREELLSYLSSIWNWIDVVRMGLTIAALVTMALREREVARLMLALGSYTYWFGLLFYLQAFSSTGPLVRMILEIISDMKFFMFVLLIAVLAFGNVFYLLTPTNTDSGYQDIPATLLTMFSFLILVDAGDVQYDAGPYAVVLKLVFVVTMVLVPIVLLNLLIALMSDSYERIQDQATIEFNRLQATILKEQELFFSRKAARRKDWYPAYLHVLVPSSTAEAQGEAEWQGVLHALKEDVSSHVQELQSGLERTNAAMAALHCELDAIKRGTSKQLDTIHALLEKIVKERNR